MMYDWYGWAWWWMAPMLLATAAIVLGAVWIFVHAPHVPDETTSRLTAEDLLSMRFARGEIDADEYRSRLETLHATPRAKEKTAA